MTECYTSAVYAPCSNPLAALSSIFDLGGIIIVFDVYPDVCKQKTLSSILVYALNAAETKGNIYVGIDDKKSLLSKQFQK